MTCSSCSSAKPDTFNDQCWLRVLLIELAAETVVGAA
jgi:hypothetical protein